MKAFLSFCVTALMLTLLFNACTKNDDNDVTPVINTTTYRATLTPAGSRTVTSATVTSGTSTTGTTSTAVSGTVISSTATSGTGSFTGVLNTTTNAMNYTLTYAALTSPIAGAYIYQATSSSAVGSQSLTLLTPPAATTAASGTALNGTVTGTATLSSAQVTSLNSGGQAYIVVPTTRYPAGEIGGTIQKQ